MAVLKPYQVAAAALLGGFPPSEVPTAVAVAKGESSYNTTSRNSCCSGLWQIHRTAHADKIRAAGGESALTDPVVNASIAYQIWREAGGWCTRGRPPNCNPWQAYGMSNAGMSWQAKMAEGARAYAEVQQRQARGESLQSMVGSAAAAADPAGLPNLPGPGDLLDAAGAIAGAAKAMIEFGNRVGAWITDPYNWVRVAEVIGGGLLVVVGLRIAFGAQIQQVTRGVVGTVAPVGKVAGRAAKVAKGMA